MYVVRRSFRGATGPMSAGSLIETPADVKGFEYRLREKHIVEVNEQNFDRYAAFFKARFGVEIPPILSDEEKARIAAEAEAKAKEDADKAEAEAKAKEDADKAEAEAKAKEDADKAEAEAKAKEDADKATIPVAKIVTTGVVKE